jgi:hypothetical protein
VRRVALVALAVAAVGAGGYAPNAAAGTECRGLLSCIRVVGPWVQVPGGPTPTYFRLACPGRGQTVGGLDADLAGLGVDVTFLGALGGPVGPGVTTGREIVFVAHATVASTVTYRPRLGCVPAAGGGGRARTSYEPTRRLTAHLLKAAAAPVAVRRVKTVRVRGRTQPVVRFACRRSEQLLAFSSALSFRTAKAPSPAQLTSIHSTARRNGATVEVTVRGRPPAGVRVDLQVHVVCGR